VRRAIALACALTAFAVSPTPGGEASRETPGRSGFPLEALRFFEGGTVRREMRFERRPIVAIFFETPDAWSSSWGGVYDRDHTIPYLFEIRRSPHPGAMPDIAFEDFEDGTYGRWTVEGGAFGARPAAVGEIFHGTSVTGARGRLADSFLDGKDAAKGKLVSLPFTIERGFISFRIGGGRHPGTECLDLRVGGSVLRTETGRHDEALLPRTWDVRDLRGKEAALEIVDAESGDWGHVLVDDILFTDVPEEEATPPLGMRSAVPLGGIGAGTVELRADGSLRDWNIFNNSPAGGRRVQLDDALLGIRAGGRAWTLRTHPPRGLPGVAALRYAGAFPVSRLTLEDPEVPVGVELYAYSEFHVRDPDGSATPAAIFTFRFRNPSDRAIEAAAMFLLPNAIGGRFDGAEGLVLSKPGTDPDSGSLVLRPDAGTASWGSAREPADLWKEFAAEGKLPGIGDGQAFGALAASLELPPRDTGTVTFVLAWHFPARRHAGEPIGNRYAANFGDAREVAGRVLGRLPETWRGIEEWGRICCDNSLPDWLRSALLNGHANFFHTTIWARDGRFRQWEAFSCPNLHPMHIHFYRSLPYTLFFPSLQKDSLRGHARCQMEDGYIREDLGNARGWDRNWSRRIMGDGCTAFVLNVWMDFIWTGDRAFLDEIWPAARRALEWQISRAKALGLPERLCTTYDWWDFQEKDVVAYNAFLHLAALAAGERMAEVEGDGASALACREAFGAGRRAVDEKLWTGRFYRSIWMRGGGIPDSLHTDTLYGQLWADILDLGHLADPARLRSHLALEAEVNPTPFGLKVFEVDADRPTCRIVEPGRMPDHRNGPRDATIWQVGSLDWCSLELYLGGPADRALEEARKVIDAWRLHLADPWNWIDTTAGWTGYPYGNSHYGRQLIYWSIPLALSGQKYSAPRRTLTFDPVAPAPARLPFFVPRACGVIELRADGSARLLVLSGRIDLAEVRLGARSPKRDVALAEGQSIEL
jgi:non-lysosomal glucosylceramidase